MSEPTEAMVAVGLAAFCSVEPTFGSGSIRQSYLAMKALDPDFATRTDSPADVVERCVTQDAVIDIINLVTDLADADAMDLAVVEVSERIEAIVRAALTPSQSDRITPEWCLKIAELEGDAEIGAGMPDHPLRCPPITLVHEDDPGIFDRLLPGGDLRPAMLEVQAKMAQRDSAEPVNDPDAWRTCPKGSCHRHAACMYRPCRSQALTTAEGEK